MVNLKKRLKNKMDVITCKHCNKTIISPELANFTLICPHCKLSVNGQYYRNYAGDKETNKEPQRWF